MTLTPRQLRLYTHRCDIIRPTTPVSSGMAGDRTYAVVAAGVPCHYVQTDNVDDPFADLGPNKRMTIFTTDVIHMDVGTDVQDGDLIRNRTTNLDGTPSPNYGQMHRVQGIPRYIVTTSARSTNFLRVMCMTFGEDKIPVGVPA